MVGVIDSNSSFISLAGLKNGILAPAFWDSPSIAFSLGRAWDCDVSGAGAFGDVLKGMCRERDRGVFVGKEKKKVQKAITANLKPNTKIIIRHIR